MTKEMIKAIRLVHGWNTDLRVKLPFDPCFLVDWIEDNRIGILGLDYAVIPDPTSDEYRRYERTIRAAARAVMSGKGE